MKDVPEAIKKTEVTDHRGTETGGSYIPLAPKEVLQSHHAGTTEALPKHRRRPNIDTAEHFSERDRYARRAITD